MSENISENPVSVRKQDRNELQKWLFLFLSHWPLFVLFGILGLVASFFIDRYTVPVYQVRSTVLLKKTVRSAITLGEQASMLGGITSTDYENFNNQKILIRTPSQIMKALNALDFNICYYSRGRFNDFEFYP